MSISQPYITTQFEDRLGEMRSSLELEQAKVEELEERLREERRRAISGASGTSAKSPADGESIAVLTEVSRRRK